MTDDFPRMVERLGGLLMQNGARLEQVEEGVARALGRARMAQFWKRATLLSAVGSVGLLLLSGSYRRLWLRCEAECPQAQDSADVGNPIVDLPPDPGAFELEERLLGGSP